MKPMLYVAAALALSACVTMPGPGSPVRSDGRATLGQPTRIGALIVTPQAVVEDSRCPVNVRCVWAGRLVLTTRIDGAGWHETVNLTLGEPYATHATGLVIVSAEQRKRVDYEPAPPAALFAFEWRKSTSIVKSPVK